MGYFSKNIVNNDVSVKGFTLIELLVSMVIFAVMAGGMYLVFNNFGKVKTITDRDSVRLAELQRAFTFIQRDLSFIIPRPIKDEFGSEQRKGALVSNGDSIEFTRGGWNSPPFLERKRSELQRVSYQLEEGKLIRNYWYVLDRAPDSTNRGLDLLTNVEELSFTFRFISEEALQSDTNWPPAEELTLSNLRNCGVANVNEIRLPDMIEMTVKTLDYGTITRNFSVVSGYASALNDGCG